MLSTSELLVIGRIEGKHSLKISTRSRYGLRLMLALAQHYGDGLLRLNEIAKEEAISEKYLSQLIIPLKANGLVISNQGAKGGYKLSRPPHNINLKDIMDSLEGGFNLVDCSRDPGFCKKACDCVAHSFWRFLDMNIAQTLESISLAKLLDQTNKKAVAL